MERLDFSEVIDLLNHSKNTTIHTKPIKAEPGQWALYSGQYKVHTSTHPFNVLYLYSHATNSGLENAYRQAFKTGETQVVYAPGLFEERKHAPLRDRFSAEAKGFWTIREYLASFLRDDLEVYLQRLSDLAPKFYIDPRYRVPAGLSMKWPNPILALLLESNPGQDGRVSHGLQEPETSGQQQEGLLGVVLAEPGQGKTYMSQDLVIKLRQDRVRNTVIPIYIHSTQWRSMSAEDLLSLAKTITHSFRYFDAPISWIAGCEEKFLEVTLKAGLFRIIFDGFDEYILWNNGKVSANDTITKLSQLASSTRTRIAVTSRTSFWQSHVSEDLEIPPADCPNVDIYEILPFDINHARRYFEIRLKIEDLIKRALSIYERLYKTASELVGRGFVLNLIADLVERESTEHVEVPETVDAIEWIMYALCEREKLRQGLPFQPDEQLDILRQFVAETVQGASPNTETLQLVIETTINHHLDLEECIKKLAPHPLIKQRHKEDIWWIEQDQVRTVLLAQYLLRMASADADSSGNLARFISKVRLDKQSESDLASMLVDLIRADRHDRAMSKVKNLVGLLLRPPRGSVPADDLRAMIDSGSKRLAVAVVLLAVDRFLSRGSSHSERTHLLLSLLPDGRLWRLPFSGTIARMDFDGVLFEECRFERVTWAVCKFSESTVFRNCQIISGRLVQCPRFGLVMIEGGNIDQEAKNLINNARILSKKKIYTENDLRADICCVIDKFLARGGLTFRSIQSRHLTSGAIGNSLYRDEIINELIHGIFEEHKISQLTDKGFSIQEDAKEAMRFYAANNVFTGPLERVFSRLRKRLGLDNMND